MVFPRRETLPQLPIAIDADGNLFHDLNQLISRGTICRFWGNFGSYLNFGMKITVTILFLWNKSL